MTNKVTAGIDFGKTHLRFGIAGDAPELKHFTKCVYTRGSPAGMYRQIYEGLDDALAQAGCARADLAGIGIAVPAVVNRETGAVAWGPDWDFMAGASLAEPIRERYGVPVAADVDTVMATWGEHWAGVGATCRRFAVLTWGTGLGAGLVLDGRVVENPGNLFPEFGHSRVSDDERLCKCGSRGCVDTMVCGGGIAAYGREALAAGKDTLIRDLCGNAPSAVTAAMVFEAAERNDAVAVEILRRVGVLIGRLCANVVLTVQPETIVIVGGLTERCGWILETVNATMRENCWFLFKGLTACEVVASRLGDTAGVLGAIRKAQVAAGRIT